MSEFPEEADVIFVGAGHNALIAASFLLDAGRSVYLVDQMSEPGGWVRTTELGAPGYLHDRWSALHPGFVSGPAWAELGPHLERHGLEYVTAPVAISSSLPDGRAAVVPVDQPAFGEELERLKETEGWNRLFAEAGPLLQPLIGLLDDGLDTPDTRAAFTALTEQSRQSALPFGSLLTSSATDLVRHYFATEELHSLAAPWPLHLGASPEDAASGFWAAFTLASLSGGTPTPVGGSGRLTDALVGLVTERGGDIRTGTDVDEILVRDGRARGIRTADGTTVRAAEAVVVSATPDQLYGRLLRNAPGVPAGVREQARDYHYRRGCFQLSLSLSARPHFRDGRLDAGGSVNLGRGLDALVTSVRQAEAGLLPQHPSIAWHEPTAVDPTRAPAGRAIARLQVLDAPLRPSGDAEVTGFGTDGWDADTAEAFADRVVAEAEDHLPGLGSLVTERHITTPADLAAQSPNAGLGDHAAGSNALEQAFTQRPVPAHGGGYHTSVPGAWLIGAATWPAPGVNGSSGRAVARALIGGADRD